MAGDGSDASLTVRDGPFGEPQDVPRGRFRLKGNVVSMEGGFEPGRTYQISYKTRTRRLVALAWPPSGTPRPG